MAVSPLDVYRIVADPTLGPEAKSQQIDMLYGVASPQNGPDARVANVDPSSIMAGSGALDQPPGPPMSMSDAGGMSQGGTGGMSAAPPGAVGAPPMMVPPAPPPTGIASNAFSAVPPQNQSSISPEELAAAAANKASTPVGGGPAQQFAPPPTDDERFNSGVGQIVGGMLRGTPAHLVAAHDQPVSSVISRAGAVPEEMKAKMGEDAEKEAGIATQQGEEAATAHLNAAISADNQAGQARSDQKELVERERAGHEHIQRLDQEFEKLVKDTAVQPSDWWTSKDTGHKILAGIGAIMFGLAGDPKGLEKVIDDDLAMKQVNRTQRLGAFKSKIDDFRARLLSPEARQSAERALAFQAASAEALRLSEAAKAPEARLLGQQTAQHFQTLSDQAMAAMAEHEAAQVQTHIAHVPGRVAGGAPNPLTVLHQAKEAGLNPEGVVRVITGGQYGSGESPDEAKRRVIFTDGQVGYVGNEGQQKETQEMASAVTGLKSAYARILDLSKSSGHTIAGKEKAQIQANVAAAMQKMQAVSKGEGANARMAGEMLKMLQPLTGAAALETGTLDANARAQIQEAYRLADETEESVKGTVTPTPKTAPSGGKIETLGKSKQSLGFEKE